MLFLISMVYAIIFIFVFKTAMKKKPVYFYIGTAVFDVLLLALYATGMYESLPKAFQYGVLASFSRGAFATALFVIVMYTGCFNRNNKLAKRLYSIRAQLSIIAALLTLLHNIAYGLYYFGDFFTGNPKLSVTKWWATLITLILILILIPLTVTSFETIRKKMSAKTWKKIQRLAYLFFGLLYVHLMLLFIPKYIQKGRGLDNIIVYTLVFGGYLISRLKKYYKDKNERLQRTA